MVDLKPRGGGGYGRLYLRGWRKKCTWIIGNFWHICCVLYHNYVNGILVLKMITEKHHKQSIDSNFKVWYSLIREIVLIFLCKMQIIILFASQGWRYVPLLLALEKSFCKPPQTCPFWIISVCVFCFTGWVGSEVPGSASV